MSGLLRVNSDLQPFLRQVPRFQVLRRVEPGARAERNKQELGRRHSGIGAAIGRRLVADDTVPACGCFKLYVPEVSNGNFHIHP
jgi:hypothetical protein